MNRNYLPPALKMQQHQSHTHPHGAPNPSLSQSPPTTSLMTYHSSSSSNILPAQALSNAALAGQQGPPSATGNNRRVHFKSTNKLPTVQEVGKFLFFVILILKFNMFVFDLRQFFVKFKYNIVIFFIFGFSFFFCLSIVIVKL